MANNNKRKAIESEEVTSKIARGAWRDISDAKKELFKLKEDFLRQIDVIEESFAIKNDTVTEQENVDEIDILLDCDNEYDISDALKKARQEVEDGATKLAVYMFFEYNFVYKGLCSAPSSSEHFPANESVRGRPVKRIELLHMINDFLVTIRYQPLNRKSPIWHWFLTERLKLSEQDRNSGKLLMLQVILSKDSIVNTLEHLLHEYKSV